MTFLFFREWRSVGMSSDTARYFGLSGKIKAKYYFLQPSFIKYLLIPIKSWSQAPFYVSFDSIEHLKYLRAEKCHTYNLRNTYSHQITVIQQAYNYLFQNG